jgi:predicted DNA-binding transcriptional regulator AlpA
MNGCPVAAHEEQSVGNHTQFKKSKKKQPSAIRSPQKTTLLKSSYKIFFSIINKSKFPQTFPWGR